MGFLTPNLPAGKTDFDSIPITSISTISIVRRLRFRESKRDNSPIPRRASNLTFAHPPNPQKQKYFPSFPSKKPTFSTFAAQRARLARTNTPLYGGPMRTTLFIRINNTHPTQPNTQIAQTAAHSAH